ncbi:MAG: ATP-binding cassette domain-containing protein, partial [Pseudomonadota bacterium]
MLELHHIHKAFAGLIALHDISLQLKPGEITALVGDNGAGKSTLVNIICGVHRPTHGEILLEGQPVNFRNPLQARDAGIEVVHQDLALAPQQPVYMNLFLGRELTRRGLLDHGQMMSQAQKLIDNLDVHIPQVRTLVRELSGGQRQAIAIARATHWARKLILLDEPTAALGVAETAKVETLIRTLKTRSLAILIISHSLDQVFRLADHICVLRRGKFIGNNPTAQTS